MSIKTRSSLPRKNKESNIMGNDEVSMNSSDEERGFQNYFQKEIEKEDMEATSENELKMRTRWENLRNSKRKTFFETTPEISRRLKRHYSPQLTSEKSISKFVEPSSNKKSKLDMVPNASKTDQSVSQADQFFQLEIQRLIASPAHYTFQPVCHVCEQYVDSINIKRCTGVCLRYYHRDCLEYPPENPLPEDINFQCPDCWTNTYSCIICKKSDTITSLLNCENTDCGRLYHKTCLDKSNLACLDISGDSIKSCPAHFCVTCSKEDKTFARKSSTKLFQCIRCPMAFHDAELCMAAGSVELSLSHVICPRHFENSLIKMNSHKPIHTDFCFRCFKAGAKLLCHLCPSSFHYECVNNSKKFVDKKDAVFVCADCRNLRQPRYGEIIFVKASQYRWWPCEIVHPRNAPMNILKLKRPDGTFPILFLGSQEYQWMAKTRTIHYNIAERSSIVNDPGGSSKMSREFSSGLKEAAKMHTIFVNILLKRVPLTTITAKPMTRGELSRYLDYKEEDKKTVCFKIIKSNIIIPPAKLPLQKNPTICDCTDRCVPSQCTNYLSKIECDKELCPTKDRCHNRLFTTHTIKKIGVNKTSNRGFGLKTTELLKENEFIIEYVGEVITKNESNIRINNAKRDNIRDFYMMRLSGDLIVDAGPKGNLSRYINHACDPNCRVEKWTVNGYVRLGIFARRDIEPDEEVTFDYRLSGVIMKEDIFCLCNSVSCSGFLGPEKLSLLSGPKVAVKSVIQEEPLFSNANQYQIPFVNLNNVKIDQDVHSVDNLDDDSDLIEIDNIQESPNKPSLVIDAQSVMTAALAKKQLINMECVNKICNTRGSVTSREDSPKKGEVAIGQELLSDSSTMKADKIDSTKNEKHEECAAEFVTDKYSLNTSLDNRESPLRLELMKVSKSVPSTVEDSVKNKETTNNFESIKRNLKRKIERHKKESSMTILIDKDSLKGSEVLPLNKESPNKPSLVRPSIEKVEDGKESLNKVNCIKASLITIDLTEDLPNDVKKKRIRRHKEPSTGRVLSKDSLGQSKDEQECSHKLERTKMSVNIPCSTTKIDLSKESTMESREVSDPVCVKKRRIRRTKEAIRESNCKIKAVDESKIVQPDLLGFTNTCLDKAELSKESPSAGRPISASHESPKKIDRIKELIRATDASIESKIILIKDVQPSTNATDESSSSPSIEMPARKDRVYESFCFRCFDGGELVLCDKQGCTKTYHLSCIGLKKAPSGTWYCPWHFCNICGDPSEWFCVQCPGSFCQSHCLDSNIRSPLSGSRLSQCHFHRNWKHKLAEDSR